MFTKENLIGFIAGIATTSIGFYLYFKNQNRIDSFLAGKGVPFIGGGQSNSLQDLVSQKERLEDLIAEHEAAPQS